MCACIFTCMPFTMSNYWIVFAKDLALLMHIAYGLLKDSSVRFNYRLQLLDGG